MRALLLIGYVVMAAWLLVAAALRIFLLLRSGSDLDLLPFASGLLGLFGLVLLVPASVDRRTGRRER